MTAHKYALGVVGTGHIATVILKRLLTSGYLTRDRVIATRSRTLSQHPIDIPLTDDNAAAIADARLVLIAVTPQKFPEAAAGMRPAAEGDRVFISLMAGMPTDRVASALSDEPVRVIRAMPNLPFGLGRGVTGLFRGRHASLDDLEEVRHLFSAGGVTVTLDNEALMDAVTAVAGSGPAYFYYFVEMLMAGGIAAGLKAEDAQVLAAHACVGAGAMLLEKNASPQRLREAVTSPGGTTQAAMNKLAECHVAEHVTEAVLAAFRRGQELGQLHNA